MSYYFYLDTDDADFFKENKFTYHSGDKGEGCVHDKSFGRLTIGNILRKNVGAVCVNGASEELKDVRPSRYVPYEPKKPESHPINKVRLEEWKTNALKTNPPDMEEEIDRFVSVVRHVGHEEFLKALTKCFEKFYEIFPKNDYTHVLLNDVDEKSEKRLRSEKWVAEVVNHEGLYDLSVGGKAHYEYENEEGNLKTRAIQQDMDKTKEIIKFMVDDAIFSGGTFRDLDYTPPVYIVPYVQSFKRLMKTKRNPLSYAAFFVNATTGTVTRRTAKKPDGMTFSPVEFLKIWKNKELLDRLFGRWLHVIVIYAEEIVDSDSVPIPFYFDHKVADAPSWQSDYWKLRGYHEESTIPDPEIERTPFISGCEEKKDVEADEEYLRGEKSYTCPYPPY